MFLENLQIDCYVHILPSYFSNLTETSKTAVSMQCRSTAGCRSFSRYDATRTVRN